MPLEARNPKERTHDSQNRSLCCQ